METWSVQVPLFAPELPVNCANTGQFQPFIAGKARLVLSRKELYAIPIATQVFYGTYSKYDASSAYIRRRTIALFRTGNGESGIFPLRTR